MWSVGSLITFYRYVAFKWQVTLEENHLLIFWSMYCYYLHKCYWFLLEFRCVSCGDLNVLCCSVNFFNVSCCKIKFNLVWLVSSIIKDTFQIDVENHVGSMLVARFMLQNIRQIMSFITWHINYKRHLCSISVN